MDKMTTNGDGNPLPFFEERSNDNRLCPLRIDRINNRKVLDEVCEKLLRRAALWEEVKDHLQQSTLGLSGGQQQRVCVARAIN